jgi:uncharacterized SAM-binding protein YcdF (DUF218 family)
MIVKSYRTPWTKSLMYFLLFLTGAAACLAIDIYTYSSKTDLQPADAAIVLGAAVWNGAPSPVFEERIKHAVDLYRSGQVKAMIFTGGVGSNDQLAEAVIAKNYAISTGVADEDILFEDTSRTTLENLRGANVIVKKNNFQRVLIVSDPLHMRRSVMMARDLGMNAYPAPTPTSRYISVRTRLEFLLREVYFYSTYQFQRPFIWLNALSEKNREQSMLSENDLPETQHPL